jgi:hypothetical protein
MVRPGDNFDLGMYIYMQQYITLKSTEDEEVSSGRAAVECYFNEEDGEPFEPLWNMARCALFAQLPRWVQNGPTRTPRQCNEYKVAT